MVDLLLNSVSGIPRTERGATMVEAAIGLPILIIFTILAVELARLAYVGYATQFVVNRVVRDAIIGPANFSPPGSPAMTEGDWINQQIILRARDYAVALQPDDVTICLEVSDSSASQNCSSNTSPGPDTFFSVQVRTDVNLLLLGSYVTGGTVLALNEKWDA